MFALASSLVISTTLLCSNLVAQAPPPVKPTTDQSNNTDPAVTDIQNTAAKVKAIKDALKEDDPDWALVLGIGSLVRSSSTDYQDESNVIRAANLGRATPQLLTGVSFRTNIPNLVHKFQIKADDKKKCNGSIPDVCPVPLWARRPFSGFVSVKFSPGSSQVLNGYAIGGSYAIAHYLNVLIGFSLTPVNEASPGFRVTASQYVLSQQKQGQYLNFNPTALLNNEQNAFDGFPVADPATQKLSYQGNPLTIHYRGGVIVGVSIPIYFGSVFK